jgi:hypothetical protein
MTCATLLSELHASTNIATFGDIRAVTIADADEKIIQVPAFLTCVVSTLYDAQKRRVAHLRSINPILKHQRPLFKVSGPVMKGKLAMLDFVQRNRILTP